MIKRIMLILLSLGVISVISADEMAMSYPWDRGNNKLLTHYDHKSIREILNSFCKTNGCKLELTDNGNYLERKVNGNFSFNSNTELITFLADKYGFSWFYYQGKLYIASNSFVLDILSVPPDYLSSLKDNLMSVGLYNPKFGWTTNTDNSTVIISGPPVYNKLVIEFTKRYTPMPRGNNFAVIKLHYANAADVNLNLNGQPYTIPGVTTIINNLTNPYILQEYQGGFQNSTQSTILLKNLISGYKNDPNVQSILGSAASNNNAKDNDANANQQVMNTYPVVQSDVRNNSVVIFDKNANLPMYEHLIHYLDIPQKMVQVNTTVIDLDEDKLDTKGVNWLANLAGVQFGFNGANVGTTNNSLSVNSAPGQTLVSAGQLNGLIANLNFLAQQGTANIQSTPSIITLMEMPALITFNTQISTFQQAANAAANNNAGNNANNPSPAQVNADSSIVITPHQINQDQYRLEILIKSSQLFDQDNISVLPILNSGTIQTQAIVAPGQGLLLGGYDQEKKVKFVSQVPGLGSIPGIGWFFKSETTKVVHIKRAYLITINLIDSYNNTLSKSPGNPNKSSHKLN
jgi:type III secretion protein C